MSIDLWAACLKRTLTPQETECLLGILPKMRRERLMKVRNRECWREPLCAYGLLRLALQRTYGFGEIPTLIQEEHGKPMFLEYSAIHFSISHTKGAVLVGLSDAPLGVDLEKLRPVSSRVLARLSAAGQTQEEYFQNWVRYEASVKRRGEGVSLHRQPDGLEDAWEVDVFPNYYAAVSGKGPVKEIHYCAVEDLTANLILS